MGRYYPISLDVQGRRCVVIGGGQVAERKACALLDRRAETILVSPEATEALQCMAIEGQLEWRQGEFEPGDLEGAFLVIAATNDAEVNQQISSLCEERGTLVNVVDVPEQCSFIVPAVCEFGPVAITVSTSGASPALAKWLRKRLQGEFGEWLGQFAAMLGEVREEVKARYNDEGQRRGIWEAILRSDALELVRQGRKDAARERIRACISSPSD